MMKKLNLLMLFALALIFFGCRTELSDTDINAAQSGSRKVVPLKEALVFKNYLAEIKNNPLHIYSKNDDFFSSLSDDATVSVITTQNLTSYSTVIRHLDRSSDVLVYSVDNENRSIGFIANYNPSDRTKNYQIDDFTGTVEYTTVDGKPMGTKELSNGVPLASKTGTNAQANKTDCTYEMNLIQVNCNGDNHSPEQIGMCTADQKPYYIVELIEHCPIVSGQSQFPDLGLYDGGGNGNGDSSSNTSSIEDALNYTLDESGFSELSREEYIFIQNNQYIGGQLLGYFFNNLDPNKVQLLHWAIDYFKSHIDTNTNQVTAWNELQPLLDSVLQYLANNPNVTWQQLYDMFLATPCEKTKNIYNNTAVKSRYEVLQGHTSDAHETGYGFKTVSDGNGGTTTQTNPLDPDAANPDKMKVGIFPKSYGYIHTHLDKADGKMAVKIFSPADINTFIAFLHNAQTNGTPLGSIFGGMLASDPDTGYNIYQILYTGNGTDIPSEFTEQQIKNLKSWYAREARQKIENSGELTHYDMQKLFSQMLKKMNLQNVVLTKMEGSNNKTFKTINFNTNDNPTEETCP